MHTYTFFTESGKYHIESLGNGWAYTVTDRDSGAEFFVQDDSAAQLQLDSDNFENDYVIDDYMSALCHD